MDVDNRSRNEQLMSLSKLPPNLCPMVSLLVAEIVQVTVDGQLKDNLRTTYYNNIKDSLQEAITHINTYGSSHTDCIITEDGQQVNRSFFSHHLSTCTYC